MSVPSGSALPSEHAPWEAACVPGVVDGADAESGDHWYRLTVDLPGGSRLEFQGLATLAEVWLDGACVARSETMFRPLLVRVPPCGAGRLDLCFRALTPGRGAGRPRWRNRLGVDEGLRGVRTALLGRVGGTGVPVMGPYRAVLLHASGPAILRRVVRARLEDGVGVLEVRLAGEGLAGLSATLLAVGREAEFSVEGDALVARMRIDGPDLWWPHTHGAPCLTAVAARVDGRDVALGAVGFRTVEARAGDGFGVLVNGVPVFCRGTLWQGGGRDILVRARDAGMTMVRVPGTARYADRSFFEACDELGLLVWQDFMFARFDYPVDEGFLDGVRAEALQVLEETAGHASLAVFCGGEEVDQAAVMAGRPAAEWRHRLFHEVLPAVVEAFRPGVPYVPNAPHGGALPIGKSAPVAHYFGIGGYLQPLADADGVRFAAACLAFANPPDGAGCRALGMAPGGRAWRDAAARDPGASWDFEDVRDHYVATLFRQDPALLRRTDPERWLAFGRAAVAVAMQSAFSTWRADPDCGGALVLALADATGGAGWGLMDWVGRPKSALHAVASVWRPVQALLRDLGMDGAVVDLLNETAVPVAVRVVLRGLTEAGGVEVLASTERRVPARGHETLNAVALMGRFRDLSGAWRFGPPPFVALGVSLLDAATGDLLSEATVFPGGPLLRREDVGLEAHLSDGGLLTLRARGFAQFVTIDDDGAVPSDDHFHLWPGDTRVVRLAGAAGVLAGSVSALNGMVAAHYRAAS